MPFRGWLWDAIPEKKNVLRKLICIKEEIKEWVRDDCLCRNKFEFYEKTNSKLKLYSVFVVVVLLISQLINCDKSPYLTATFSDIDLFGFTLR